MELLGRLPELTACTGALSGDRHHAAAAIIAGPSGIGKTSLWRAVADCQPGDVIVLRTTGIPGARAGLASVADLLDPIMDVALPLIPAPQASALRAALGQISPQAPVTDMLLERAIVGMLRGLAVGGLLIAVDDEQWLDNDSRRLLETAVVRLAGVPVRWLVSVRSEHAGRGLARMLCHELGPRAAQIDLAELGQAALAELIMARFPGQWSPGVLREITTLAAATRMRRLRWPGRLSRAVRGMAPRPASRPASQPRSAAVCTGSGRRRWLPSKPPRSPVSRPGRCCGWSGLNPSTSRSTTR
jgi:hypothetical protein